MFSRVAGSGATNGALSDGDMPAVQARLVPQITTIERNVDGVAQAIVGPFGQITTLTVNADQQLERVTDPAGNSHEVTYHDDGLLDTFTKPNGGTTTFAYANDGRLESDEAAGARLTFSREGDDETFSVTRLTELGRRTVFGIAPNGEDHQLRTVTHPDETMTLQDYGPNGSVTTFADGSSVDSQKIPDDLWGTSAALQTVVTTLPSGRQISSVSTRTSGLTDPLDPFTRTTFTEGVALNGKTTTTTYNVNNRQFTTTTPGGRQLLQTVDSLGRTSQLRFGQLTAINLTYDDRGRLQAMTQGARNTQFTYLDTGDGAGALATITDPVGRTATFTRDALGRVTNVNFAASNTAFDWDAVGNLTGVTPPGKPHHQMGYNTINLLEEYTPPDLPSIDNPTTDYIWDLDRDLDFVSRPDGHLVDFTYNAAGKLQSIDTPTTTLTSTYFGVADTATGQAPGALRTLTTSEGVELAYEYDGPIVTAETSSSPALTSTVRRAYGTDVVPTSEQVQAGSHTSTIAFGYDNDRLLTCASPSVALRA